jgi:hypothetical protein
MEPLAIAAYVFIASAVVLAMLFGALGGAVARVVGRGLPWIAVLTAGAYLVATVLLDSYRLGPAVVIGMPYLLFTLLTCWLTGHYLEFRAGLRRIPAAFVALGCTLLIGYLWGFLLRLGLWAALATTLVADAGLVVWLGLVLYRGRRSPAAPAHGVGHGREPAVNEP